MLLRTTFTPHIHFTATKYESSYLDRGSGHLSVHHDEGPLHPVRGDTMGPETIGSVVRAIVAGLAHSVVVLDVEGVAALHRWLVVLAGSPARVSRPIDEIGTALQLRRTSGLVVPEGVAVDRGDDGF